jgi:FkbM family methyltransferase
MLKRDEVWAYWRESRRLRDFVWLLRVRLSRSKIGPLVCPRPITVDVDLTSLGESIRLRSHTTDISVLNEVVVWKSYETLVGALEGEPELILDLGANIGLASRWFLRLFPTARLISVEPDAGNLAVLRHNLAGYGDRSTVVGAAIGARSRRVALRRDRGEFGFAISELDAPDDDGDADVVTMASLVGEVPGTIDLLKCDIEGAERELFEDCSDWLPRVQLASVECHLPFGETNLLDLLRANGARADVIFSESTPQFGCESVVVRLRSRSEPERVERALA